MGWFSRVAETDGQGAVKFYSRNQNDFKKRFLPIAQALAELGRPTILDGEIVALDEQGHPHFEWLVNRGPQRGTLVYYVFDLLTLDGKDLRQQPLSKRKERLNRLLARHPRLLDVEHIEKEGLALVEGALALGLEGIVAKDAKSPYVEGPAVTWHWQKIKNRDYKRQEEIEFHQWKKKD